MLSSHLFSSFLLLLQFLGQIWRTDQQAHHRHRERSSPSVQPIVGCCPQRQYSAILEAVYTSVYDNAVKGTKTNVFKAAFTICHAQLKLYESLDIF